MGGGCWSTAQRPPKKCGTRPYPIARTFSPEIVYREFRVDQEGASMEGSTATYTDITYEVANNVAWIEINRPEKLNAFRQLTLKEMMDAVARASADKQVGVLVLSGAGDRAFCAGGDVEIENEESFTSGDESLDELNKQLY